MALAEREANAVGLDRFLPLPMDDAALTGAVLAPLLETRVGRIWWSAFLVSLALTVMMVVAILWLFWKGIGIFGLNQSNIWGFAIANYVWWIGIGNAGTLISSMLLLTRQRWRASINRFAEAMTLFAAAIAGLYPILHLGRPWFFYWLMPYPSTMGVWPQWRSPLVWDFFAIASYLIFSLIFWFSGLIPDLASARDRARSHAARRAYGFFALGWSGSARDWQRLESFYGASAAMAVPLVVSVHSVVGLDFSAGIAPGWAETIFPPYFVVGAAFSGFAMVATLAVPIRWGFGLQALITRNHLDLMGKMLLALSLIMTASYATEWLMTWYAGGDAERAFVAYEFTGDYAVLYWVMLAGNVAAPQALWLPRVRRTPWALLAVALAVNVGMWLERILITVATPSHDYLPSSWKLYWPTLWDWMLWIGTLGFFAFLFLIFVRLVPFISLHEVRKLGHERGEG
jgi:molybdopterin-containing oxidoreductase family membrane subunit